MNRRSMLKKTGIGVGAVLKLDAMAAAAEKSAKAQKSTKSGTGLKKLPYHHIGVPTKEKLGKERYLEGGKMYVTDPAENPFRIEWLRFEADSPNPERMKKEAHIAFEVKDLDAELAKYKPEQIFIKPFVPWEGLRVAFVDYHGQLIEFVQITAKA